MLEAEAKVEADDKHFASRSVWLKWLSLFDRCSLVRFRQRQMRRSSAAVSTSLVLAVQLSTYERDDPIIDRSADVATRCVVALVEPRPRRRLSISKQSTRYHIYTRSLDVTDLSSCRNS